MPSVTVDRPDGPVHHVDYGGPATAMFAAFLTAGIGRAMLARRRLRSAAQVVEDMLRLCCSDPSRVPADVVAQHTALAEDRRAFRRADAELLTRPGR